MSINANLDQSEYYPDIFLTARLKRILDADLGVHWLIEFRHH